MFYFYFYDGLDDSQSNIISANLYLVAQLSGFCRSNQFSLSDMVVEQGLN